MVEETAYNDALPLLAFTLEKLWNKCQAQGRLTVAAYDELGGVTAAIKHVADKVLEDTGYAGLPADDDRMRDLRRAFYSLARVGEEGQFTQEMVKDVRDAYIARDAEKADLVRRRDEELDSLHTSIFRELLTYMMEDARNITACTHLLFIAKNIERIGDHATNIAEVVLFVVRGRTPGDQRPKDDVTSFTVLQA